jgi:excisionase family DNA binding protein
MSTMPIVRDDETYLTTQEACDFLHVSRQTVNRLVRQGRLHQHKQGVTRTVYYLQSELAQVAEIQPIKQPTEDPGEQ